MMVSSLLLSRYMTRESGTTNISFLKMSDIIPHNGTLQVKKGGKCSFQMSDLKNPLETIIIW